MILVIQIWNKDLEMTNLETWQQKANRVFPILVLDLAELDELD